MENNEKYLPLGTVVMLNGGTKRLMITGYAPIDAEKKDKVYDYCGCLFPAGVISTDETLLFDHDQISKIYALGYQDEDGKKFLDGLKQVLTAENISKLLEQANKSGE